MARGDGARWDALMADVVARAEPTLRRRVTAVLVALRRRYTVPTLERMLERGALAELAELPAPLAGELRRAVQEAVVRVAVQTVPEAAGIAGVGTMDVAFDTLNPGAVTALREHGARLVREVTASQRQALVDVIEGQLRAGLNPREGARLVRELIGLTARQAQAVASYRSALQTGDRGALLRALRDRRSDRLVARVAAGETTLSAAQVESLTSRYSARMLAYRAEVIARTESIRALSAGRRLAYDQMLASPETGLTPGDMVRRWVVAADERTCRICRPIPQLNPDGVGYDEAFVTPRGPRMEAPLHPQCRCVVLIQPRLAVVT